MSASDSRSVRRNGMDGREADTADGGRHGDRGGLVGDDGGGETGKGPELGESGPYSFVRDLDVPAGHVDGLGPRDGVEAAEALQAERRGGQDGDHVTDGGRFGDGHGADPPLPGARAPGRLMVMGGSAVGPAVGSPAVAAFGFLDGRLLRRHLAERVVPLGLLRGLFLAGLLIHAGL